MNLSLMCTRLFFSLITLIFMVAYMLSYPEGGVASKVAIGVGLGSGFAMLLIGFEWLLRRFNLRSFNIAILGLFIGYLMGQALVLVFTAVMDLGGFVAVSGPMREIPKIGLFLFGTYMGALMTLRASEEIYISIPFVRLTQSAIKKKDIILDHQILNDVRLFDLCASSLLNNQIILPRFVIKEYYDLYECGDEPAKMRAKRCLDMIKKLEALPLLQLRYNETDFTEIKDVQQKVLRLARLLDANVLTADLNRLQLPPVEGIEFINVNSLSNALKPLMPAGETITIKIQRYGKEPKQGVGYLDDGTMVVINNGGEYIGETIETQVISIKQTSAGRIIFTNALVEDNAFNQAYAAYDSQPV